MVMKPRDFEDAQKILNNLKTGNLGRRDVTALLIYVREELPNDMVKDLAHSVAHSDRDRGYAYKYINKFVSDMIHVTRHGGAIPVKPIFSKSDLVAELAKDFSDIGFDVTEADIDRNYEVMEACLVDILDDMSIHLVHANVKSCRFTKWNDEEMPKMAFVVFTQGLASGGVLQVPENVGMAFPVFSE
jgi:hypothetical protein